MSDDEGSKRDFDAIVADEAIRSLMERLDDSTFKSSARIMLLVLIALARRMTSVQLRTLTGLGKGSLENHLGKLESFGYIKVSYSKSMGARGVPRQTVEITEKGLAGCRELLRGIKALNV